MKKNIVKRKNMFFWKERNETVQIDFPNNCPICSCKLPHKLELNYSMDSMSFNGLSVFSDRKISWLSSFLSSFMSYDNTEREKGIVLYYITDRGRFEVCLTASNYSNRNENPNIYGTKGLSLYLSHHYKTIVNFPNKSEDLKFIESNIKLFKETLLDQIPYNDQLCNSCLSKIVQNEKILEKERKKMQEGRMCSSCGKTYSSSKVFFCDDCGSEVKFKNYCYNCDKPTYTKFCSTCGSKILL